MRLLFIAHCTDLSGANKSFLSVLDCMKSENEITVLVNSRQGQLVDELERRKLQYIVLNYSWWVACSRKNIIKQLARIILDSISYYSKTITETELSELKIENFDMVYSNTSTIDVGVKIAKYLNIPHIWHFREFGKEDFGFKPIVSKQKIMSAYLYTEKFIFISKALAKKYENIIPSSKCEIVPNGLEVNQFIGENKEALQNKNINVLVTGQVCSTKGQEYAIRAVALLRRKRTNVFLHIAGEIDQTYVNSILKDFPDYSNWIFFHGQVKDMYELRNNTFMEVVCSRSEAFGRVTLEAMLHGVPMIGANTGGTPELIIHGETGLLYEYGDVEQLTNCMEMLIEDRKLYERIVDQARRYANEFSIQKTVERIENIMCEIKRKNK